MPRLHVAEQQHQSINGNPTADKLEKIAAAIDCAPAELFEKPKNFVALVSSGDEVRRFDRPDAVSYTHLDVYKRQVEICAEKPRAVAEIIAIATLRTKKDIDEKLKMCIRDRFRLIFYYRCTR